MAMRHGTFLLDELGIPWSYDLDSGVLSWEAPGASKMRNVDFNNLRQVSLADGTVVNEEMLVAQAVDEMAADGVFDNLQASPGNDADLVMSRGGPPMGASPVTGTEFSTPQTPAILSPRLGTQPTPQLAQPTQWIPPKPPPDALISVQQMVIKALTEIVKASKADEATMALVEIFNRQIETEYTRWNGKERYDGE